MLYVRRACVRKGFLGDSRGWKVAGIIVFGVRFVRSVVSGHEIVTVERLDPGQTMSITAIAPPAKRRR